MVTIVCTAVSLPLLLTISVTAVPATIGRLVEAKYRKTLLIFFKIKQCSYVPVCTEIVPVNILKFHHH
jgi:hypothetical protein